MTRAEQARLLTAEVRWGDDSSAIQWIGTAPVHQYWPLLSPHFSASFLPPQRRMEGDAVAWSWREIAAAAPTGGELSALRAQLAGELRKFVDSQPGAGSGDEEPAHPQKNRANLALLIVLMQEFVAELLAKPDHELAKFVAQTEAGLRLHSWGARNPAQPLGPEQLGREVSGMALQGGKAAGGVEVLLESSEREFKAQVLTDESGHFRFQNISRGRYRLHGRHSQLEFDPRGLEISAAGEPLTGLKLRAVNSLAETGFDSADDPSPPRRRRRPLLLIGGAIAVGGGLLWMFWDRLQPGSRPVQSESSKEVHFGPPANGPTAEGGRAGGNALPAQAEGRSSRASGQSNSRSSSGFAGSGPSFAGPKTQLKPSAPLASSSPGAATNPAASRESEPSAKEIPKDARSVSPSAAAGSKTTDRSPKDDSKNGRRSQSSGPIERSSAAKKEDAKPERAAKHSPSSNSARSGKEADASQPEEPQQPQASKSGRSSPRSSPPAAELEEQDHAAGSAPAPDDGWAHRTRVRASDWKTRLLIDPILPTAPTGETSLAAVEAMRQRLLAEQRAKIPHSFVQPHGDRGYTVDFSAADQSESWHWETPAPSAAFRAEITPPRAELGWSDGSRLPPGKYRLADRRGMTLVQLTIVPGAGPLIESAPEIRIRYWLQVQIDPADRAAPDRFKWQRTSGGRLPPTWTQEARNGAMRVEAPIETWAGRVQSDRIALFDTDSGWGLTASLTQTPSISP